MFAAPPVSDVAAARASYYVQSVLRIGTQVRVRRIRRGFGFLLFGVAAASAIRAMHSVASAVVDCLIKLLCLQNSLGTFKSSTK